MSSLEGALLSGVELTFLMSPRENAWKRLASRLTSEVETSKPSNLEVLGISVSPSDPEAFFYFLAAKDLT